MASDNNQPSYLRRYYGPSGQNTGNFYIENDWLYKPCKTHKRLYAFNVAPGADTTYSGYFIDAEYLTNADCVAGEAIKDGYLYLLAPGARTYGCITVADVTTSGSPSYHSYKENTSYMRYPKCACILGDHMYVAGEQVGTTRFISIWDLSNPGSPSYARNWGFGSVNFNGSKLYAYNNHLYFSYAGTVHIYEVSNPVYPTQVGSFSAIMGTVHFSGDYAFIASSVTVYIVDISDIENPNVIHYWNPDSDTGFTVIMQGVWFDSANDYLYLGAYYQNRGILAYDISTKTNPVLYDVLTAGGPSYPGRMLEYNGEVFVTGYYNTDSSDVRVFDFKQYKFSGNATNDTHVWAVYPSDFTVLDDWEISAGTYTIKPVYVNDPVHLFGVNTTTSGIISYGIVTPVEV